MNYRVIQYENILIKPLNCITNKPWADISPTGKRMLWEYLHIQRGNSKHTKVHSRHLHCVVPAHSNSQTPDTAGESMCWYCALWIENTYQQKPIKFFMPKWLTMKMYHLQIRWKKKSTNTRSVECLAPCSSCSSAHHCTAPLQCGTSNAVRGYSSFEAQSY